MIADLFADVSSQATYAPHFLGPKYKAQADIPPRYVWEPMRNAYSTPMLIGSTVAGHGSGASVAQPKRLLTKLTSISVHCWGATYDECEIMEELLIHQLHKSLQRAVTFDGSEWLNPEWSDYSPVLTLAFTADMTVPERDVATGALLTPAFAGPPLSVVFAAGDPIDGILQPGDSGE